MSTTIRVKIDANGPQVEVEEDIDVYVHLEGETDVADRQLQIRFTAEGVVIDTFEEGDHVATSSETFDELYERLARA